MDCFQGVSAELLAQKERLKKKMQQQIRRTYKVSSCYILHVGDSTYPPFIRSWMHDMMLFRSGSGILWLGSVFDSTISERCSNYCMCPLSCPASHPYEIQQKSVTCGGWDWGGGGYSRLPGREALNFVSWWISFFFFIFWCVHTQDDLCMDCVLRLIDGLCVLRLIDGLCAQFNWWIPSMCSG